MVKRSCFARGHNGSQAASSQSKVICYRICYECDSHATTQDNDVQAHILKSPNFCKYTLRTYRDTFK